MGIGAVAMPGWGYSQEWISEVYSYRDGGESERRGKMIMGYASLQYVGDDADVALCRRLVQIGLAFIKAPTGIGHTNGVCIGKKVWACTCW